MKPTDKLFAKIAAQAPIQYPDPKVDPANTPAPTAGDQLNRAYQQGADSKMSPLKAGAIGAGAGAATVGAAMLLRHLLTKRRRR
jgi:hypothetical protein